MDPLAQLRDSKENSELWRNSIKIFRRNFKFTLHKGDSQKKTKVQPRGCSKNVWEFERVYRCLSYKNSIDDKIGET